MAYQEPAKGKTTTPLRADEIYAIVPGPEQSESLANLIADPKNFQGLGERSADDAFTERMSLLVAVAGSVTGQGAAKLQQVLLSEMLDAARKITRKINAPTNLFGLTTKWQLASACQRALAVAFLLVFYLLVPPLAGSGGLRIEALRGDGAPANSSTLWQVEEMSVRRRSAAAGAGVLSRGVSPPKEKKCMSPVGVFRFETGSRHRSSGWRA